MWLHFQHFTGLPSSVWLCKSHQEWLKTYVICLFNRGLLNWSHCLLLVHLGIISIVVVTPIEYILKSDTFPPLLAPFRSHTAVHCLSARSLAPPLCVNRCDTDMSGTWSWVALWWAARHTYLVKYPKLFIVRHKFCLDPLSRLFNCPALTVNIDKVRNACISLSMLNLLLIVKAHNIYGLFVFTWYGCDEISN